MEAWWSKEAKPFGSQNLARGPQGPGPQEGAGEQYAARVVFSSLGTPPERRGGQLGGLGKGGGEIARKGGAGPGSGGGKIGRRRWVRGEEKGLGKEESQGKSGAWLRGKKLPG